MDNSEVTQRQMYEFCKAARQAVAADYAIMITSVQNRSNLASSFGDDVADDEEEVLEMIAGTLALSILSVLPGCSVTIHAPDGSERDDVSFTPSGVKLNVTEHKVTDSSEYDDAEPKTEPH